MLDCPLIVDPPADGDWNMAVDEILLEAAEEGIAAVRFYSWREPTLSLGYFQAHRQRAEHAASHTCPMVRRTSGGGAIMHDRELTYCVALPAFHPLARHPDRLYDAAHQSLAKALALRGIDAQVRSRVDSSPPATEPFLCFQRRTAGDLLVGDFKVAGSAQRRRRGAVLQHGSILLGRSAFAPELPGIEELTGRTIAPDHLQQGWQGLLAERLGVKWLDQRPADQESGAARILAKKRFANDEWTCRR